MVYQSLDLSSEPSASSDNPVADTNGCWKVLLANALRGWLPEGAALFKRLPCVETEKNHREEWNKWVTELRNYFLCDPEVADEVAQLTYI